MINLEFHNLPLKEVSARLTPANLLPNGLHFYANLFAQLQEREFDRVVDVDSLVRAPGQFDEFTISPLSAVAALFLHKTKGVTLRFQPNLIMISWIKGSSETEVEYPRFPEIRKVASDAIDAVTKVLAHNVSFHVANLSYQNILVTPRAHPEQALEYFEDTVIPVAIDKSKQCHKLEWSTKLDSECDFRFKLEGIDSSDESYNFSAETSCGMIVKTEDGLSALDIVHDELCRIFPSIISLHAKEEWGFSNE